MKKPKVRQQDTENESSTEYLCGVRVGERVRLLQELVMRDERGNPTSDIRKPGEVWTVMPPNPEKPWRVFLHEPDGFPHYWSDSNEKFWSWFERVYDDETAR
jgi:hypothetical protein